VLVVLRLRLRPLLRLLLLAAAAAAAAASRINSIETIETQTRLFCFGRLFCFVSIETIETQTRLFCFGRLFCFVSIQFRARAHVSTPSAALFSPPIVRPPPSPSRVCPALRAFRRRSSPRQQIASYGSTRSSPR
jgi:hypothetical protein